MISWLKRHSQALRLAALIFGIALVVRALYAVWAGSDPSTATTDAYFYHHSARFMADGRGYAFPGHGPHPTAYWPPGYTAFLSAVYILPGPDIAMGKAFNVTLGGLTCAGVFALGRMLWSRAAGLVAGLTLAFFPGHVFFSALLLTETLYTSLVVALLLVFVWSLRHRESLAFWSPAAIGLLLGVASLVRGEGVLLFVLFGAVWWLATRSLRQGAQFAGLMALGLVAVLSVWMVRNAIELDAFIPINTGSSVVLDESHWSEADGDGQKVRAAFTLEYFEELPYPEREVRAYRKRTNDAVRYMLTHPAHEAEMVPERIAELYNHDHDAIDWMPRDGRSLGDATLDRLSFLSDVYYFATLVLAGAGAVLWARSRLVPAALLLGLVAYTTALIGLLFFGDQRYHAVLTPVCSLLAAPAVLAAAGALAGIFARVPAPSRAGQEPRAESP